MVLFVAESLPSLEDFYRVLEYSPETYVSKKSSSIESINRAAIAILAHLRANSSEVNLNAVKQFINILEVIERENPSIRQTTTFKTQIISLERILRKRFEDRKTLTSEKPPLLGHIKSFLKSYSSEKCTERTKSFIERGLGNFQEELLKTINAARSPEEFQNVKEIINKFGELCSLINKAEFNELYEQSVNAYNIKYFTKLTMYEYLINYKQGKGENPQYQKERGVVSRVEKLIESLDNYKDQLELPEADKIALYNGLTQLREDFNTIGDSALIDPLLVRLRNVLGIQDTDPHEEEASVTQALKLRIEELTRNLYAASPSEAVTIYQPEMDQILKELSRISTNPELTDLKKRMTNAFIAKKFKSYPLYITLTSSSYQKGELGNLSDEQIREENLSELNAFFVQFMRIIDHHLFEEDKFKFLNNLSVIKEEFHEAGYGSSIDPLIETLNLKLGGASSLKKETPVSRTHVAALRKRFTDPPSPASPPLSAPRSRVARASPPQPSEHVREVRESPPLAPKSATSKGVKRAIQSQLSEKERKAALLEKILHAIQGLKFDQKDLKTQIHNIEANIEKLKRLDPSTTMDFASVEEILKILRDPQNFKASSEENRFIKLLIMNCRFLKELPLEEKERHSSILNTYEGTERANIIEAQKSLLKILKSCRTFEILKAESAKFAISLKEIRENIIRSRWNTLIEAYPLLATEPLNRNFSQHLPFLINIFSEFSNNYIKNMMQSICNQIKNKLNAESSNKFSELLKNYSYLDPEKNDFFLIEFEEHLFTQLNLSDIDQMDLNELRSYLENVLERVKEDSVSLFWQYYKEKYLERHSWLVLNADAIITPCNQGDDAHRNLGSGVCFANCLKRCAALMNDPEMPDPSIDMKITHDVMFVQSLGRHQHLQRVKEGEITESESLEKMMETASTFGLKWSGVIFEFPLPKEDDPHAFLMEKIREFVRKGHSNFILGLYGEGGHAINIQIDVDKKIFRFMDDNLGLVSYKTFREFREHFKGYLQEFYNERTFYRFFNFMVL